MVTQRHGIVLIILGAVALLVIVVTRKQHAMGSTMDAAGIAENQDMIENADSLIVGDSNAGECCPTGRRALANVPWQRYMGIYPALRSTSRQPRVTPMQHNAKGATPLEIATVFAAAAGG